MPESLPAIGTGNLAYYRRCTLYGSRWITCCDCDTQKNPNGILEPINDFILDKASLPEGLNAPFVINSDRSTYLVDTYEGEIVDGL